MNWPWMFLLLLVAWAKPDGAYSKQASFHIVFSTECTTYFDWQSLALLESYVQVNQTESITRLMACDNEDYSGKDLTDRFPNANTYIHPNYAKHPKSGDHYPAYNKPYSVLHWLEHNEIEEEFIVFLDADMVIRSKINIEAVQAKLGQPVSAFYGYLKGVDKESYMEVKAKVPNVEMAQKVGGFMIMHREDMKRVAPWWLHYTEEVRNNKGNWANTGDVFNDNGKKGPPWISEMYGYIFGCAHANVTHRVSDAFMLYPGYEPPQEPFPFVLHYGITFFVDDYAFDKHWFPDLTTCPGTNIDYPLTLEEIEYQKPNEELYRKNAIALLSPQVLHKALEDHQRFYCKTKPAERYRRIFSCDSPNNIITCKPGEKLRGSDLLQHIESAKQRTKVPLVQHMCNDKNKGCCNWARSGECTKNPEYMRSTCEASCGICGSSSCIPKAMMGENVRIPTAPAPLQIEESDNLDPIEAKNMNPNIHGNLHHVSNAIFAMDDEVDANVFTGVNGALFKAIPYWGALAVCMIILAGIFKVLPKFNIKRFVKQRKLHRMRQH